MKPIRNFINWLLGGGEIPPPRVWQHKDCIPGQWDKVIVIAPYYPHCNSGTFRVGGFEDNRDYASSKKLSEDEVTKIVAKIPKNYVLLDFKTYAAKYGLQDYLEHQ